MTLTAEPQIVAYEAPANGRMTWNWLMSADDVAVLKTAVREGRAGTCQRRTPAGNLELLAWDVNAQKAAAAQQKPPAGTPRRIYLPPAKPRGMRTYAPFYGDPARWLE